MECSEVSTHLLDRRRGTLPAEVRSAVEAHLAQCERCRVEDAADRELSIALESRLARPRAPEELRRVVQRRWGGESALRRPRAAVVARWVGAMALGAALAMVAIFGWRGRRAGDVLTTEALNDHLRLLYSDHPLEVASSDRHVVKPWFSGRIDFAPDFAFNGDDDFPLQGGAIAYFVDRKAAAFLFKRRLHWLTVLVFRADGLPWPMAAPERLDGARGTMFVSRGFHVLLWRKGDLGYAVVSDVDERDVRALAGRIAGGQ